MTTETPATCPSCNHPSHQPGAECEAGVEHGPKRWHRCLCLNRPGAALPCPPQLTCQGGPLGYTDIWYLQRGHTLSGANGEKITPDVLKTPPAARTARWEAAAHAAGREVDRNALAVYMAVADAEQAEMRREHAERLDHIEGALARIRDNAEVAEVRVRRVLAFAEQVVATSGPGPASTVQAVIDRLGAAVEEQPASDPSRLAGEARDERETQAEDPARIDRLRPEFTDHASIESIDAQLRRARSQLRRWHLRAEWLISLRQARVEQKERGEWPAAVSQPGKEA
jgi:hypothetical protein